MTLARVAHAVWEQKESNQSSNTKGLTMSEHHPESKHEVRIHIDQHKYESPNPTTGAALYILGKVASGLELYREVTGNHEDQPIDNGPEIVHLKEDEHFHSGPPKTYTIFVNGQKKTINKKMISFAEVVALAYPTPATIFCTRCPTRTVRTPTRKGRSWRGSPSTLRMG